MENQTSKNKKSLLLTVIQIVIIFASIVFSIYFYQHFPVRVPIHWNIAGQADGYGSRAVGAFMLPILIVAIYLLLELLPKIDPRKDRYKEFSKSYSIIKTAIIAVLFCIYMVSGFNSLGYNVSVGFWIPVIIGMLFVVIGNYFGKIRNNYFVGIRTPWTLSSEEVWNKTHRLGGKLFVIGGVLMLFVGVVPMSLRLSFLVAIIIIIAVVPIFYSYFIYKKLQK